MADARRRLSFPLDYATVDHARRAAAGVAESVGVLKVGLELFVKEGPSATRLGREFDCDVFLDLKLHDIPATVDGAVARAAELGVKYLTIHASGGHAMVEAAVSRAAKEAPSMTILAVTVLTSLDDQDLIATGVQRGTSDQVLALASLAYGAGARGFVCSPGEIAPLRAALGADVVLVTPGIRPAGAAVGDQKRVGTPTDAIRAGASVLVVGRPIRDAADPRAAARQILAEIVAAEAAP
jgi:orotidine-5'-phosphate decarboxylase